MRNARVRFLGAVLGATMVAGGFLFAAQDGGQGTKAGSNQGNKTAHIARAQNVEDEGERVFMEHCSRCHNAPQSISPRITGTVVRHMRVRANLTAEEERTLLKFFNP